MSKKMSRLRGVALGLAAAVVTSMGLVAPAMAADPPSINPDATGSIHLTKYSSTEKDDTPQNGLINPTVPDGSETLAGATFQLYKLTAPPIDLTTNAGWTALQTFISNVGTHPSAAEIAAMGGTVTPHGTPQTTLADGQINWTGLPLGVYYVVETSVPAGHQAAAPFFVTLPMTHPTDLNEWLYEVYVYPKNMEDTSTKIPLDTDVPKAGDELTWQIKTTVPGDAQNHVTILKFVDTLDAALKYKSANVSVGGTPLGAADYDVVEAGQNITISLTPAGLDKLNTGKLWGEEILVNIVTTVTDSYVGVIDNEAQIITNKPGTSDETTPVTTPKTESKYGKITVNKVNKDGAPLAGAEFDVYYSHTHCEPRRDYPRQR